MSQYTCGENEESSQAVSFGRFGRNAVIYGVGIVAMRLVAFLPIPLYTRYLSIDEFGLLEILLVTVQLMQFVMLLGMVPTFMRFYGDHARRNTVGELLGSTLLAVVAGSVATTALCLVLLPPLFSTTLHVASSYQTIALACGVASTQALSIILLTYFRAGNKPVFYTIASMGLAGLVIVSICVFVVLFKLRVNGILLAQIAANAAGFVGLSVWICRKVRLSCSLAAIGRNLAFGFPLALAMCGWLLMRIFDRFFLGHFESLAVVGMYSLGIRMTSIMQILVVSAFEHAFLPFVFSHAGDPQLGKIFGKVFSLLLLVSVLTGFGMILFSREFIRIAGPAEYYPAYKVVIWAVPVCMLSGLYCWVYGILCTIKRTWVIGVVLSLSTCLCFGLNYLLIPLCGWLGAVLATTTAYLLCMAALSAVALACFSVEFEWNRLFAVLMIALSLLFLCIISFDVTSYGSYVGVVLMPALPFVFGFFDMEERTTIKSLALCALSWNRKRVRA